MFANLCCLLIPAALLASADDPIIALVKAKHKDATKPFAMIVTFQAKDGAEKQIEATFAPCLKASRKDKGCLLYELHGDPDKPRTYVLLERWHSVADLEKHLQAEHTKKLLKDLSELLQAPPEVRVLRAVE